MLRTGARSAAQIASNKIFQIVSAPGLIGRWSLDEGTGTVATNTGSTNINGTLVNGPVWGTGYPRPRWELPMDKELEFVDKHCEFYTERDRERMLGENALRIWRFPK